MKKSLKHVVRSLLNEREELRDGKNINTLLFKVWQARGDSCLPFQKRANAETISRLRRVVLKESKSV